MWPFSVRGTVVRLFVTCWTIYMLHSATNIVREHYLAFAIGDRLSFRVDEYRGLHPDLFETPGRGWHINNNPGVSMLAAVPYALSRPLIDPLSRRLEQARARGGDVEPPSYGTPWPNARAFYAEAWRRGLDVKLGLGAMAIQAGFMAPVSALAVVGMFLVLRSVFGSIRVAFWLSMLFAFGTPVFFRTGFLNQNVVLGYVAAAGVLALWKLTRDSSRRGPIAAVAGAAGGAAILLDYSGMVILAGLAAFCLYRAYQRDATAGTIRMGASFAAGAIVPLALLWFYQWASFGHPFLPAQRWMPDVAWATTGYRGVEWPMPDLLLATLFDYRFGLFVSCPLMLLALAAPWVDRGRLLPRDVMWFVIGLFIAFWLFCGSVNYGRLQFNTGIRYMSSMVPLLFLLATVVLVRLPRHVMHAIVIGSIAISWPLAMHRDVERGFGVLDPILHVFVGGFELPMLTTASRMSGAFGEVVARGVSPLPLFVLVGAVLCAVWWPPGTPTLVRRKD